MSAEQDGPMTKRTVWGAYENGYDSVRGLFEDQADAERLASQLKEGGYVEEHVVYASGDHSLRYRQTTSVWVHVSDDGEILNEDSLTTWHHLKDNDEPIGDPLTRRAFDPGTRQSCWYAHAHGCDEPTARRLLDGQVATLLDEIRRGVPVTTEQVGG